MAREWRNWSGSLRFTPHEIARPESEAQVQELVRRAWDAGQTVRPVGKGHSSTPLVATDDILVSLERMTGVQSVDREAGEAWVLPGTTLEEIGDALIEDGLVMFNQGDVNVQHLAGAIGTGTHGTGRNFGNLSTMLLGLRMVTASGEVIERNIEGSPDFVRAARVALGTLGIFTSLRIKLLPRYKLHRQEWCTSVEACLANLDELIETNQHFDFYWYPRSDEVKLRTLNRPGETLDIPFARLLEDKEEQDWAPHVLSKDRALVFDEMEYALPFADGPEVFREVRRRVRKTHRRIVGWRVLYRTVAPDDAMLSTNYKRATTTLALLQNAELPYWDYFNDIEPLFREHAGRPHWGKKHNLKGPELAALYPEWDSFQRLRHKMDPEGLFMTGYLRELFGLETPEKEAP